MAIKVVEHTQHAGRQSGSTNSPNSPANAEAKIARELLLSTSIAHPNVIATYKICTIRVGTVPDAGILDVSEVSRAALAHGDGPSILLTSPDVYLLRSCGFATLRGSGDTRHRLQSVCEICWCRAKRRSVTVPVTSGQPVGQGKAPILKTQRTAGQEVKGRVVQAGQLEDTAAAHGVTYIGE